MLKLIKLTYSGTLLLPDGPDPFGPWACLARKYPQGYRAFIGGAQPSTYHETLHDAVKESAELSLCAPVANLRVVEG